MSTANAHFNKIERAPCEFGNLLRKLPYDFPAGQAMADDDRLMVKAAIRHADNANHALMDGMEALGQMVFSAATNDSNPIDPTVLSNFGMLIRHIAVEAQFLQEQQADLQASLDSDDRRAATSPLSQKGGSK